MCHDKENTQLLNSFLDRSFFSSWKNPNNEKYLNFRTLELIINSKCDLECKYCYLNKFGKEYFPIGSEKEENILANIESLFNWLGENKYKPVELELFSGDLLSQKFGLEILHKCIDLIDWKTSITIPTNMNFLFSDSQTESVKSAIEKSKNKGICLSLSASVDGIYMEPNRPPKSSKKLRNDNFYHNLFSFSKEYNVAFHPMIYSKEIEKWVDNFLWFQEMFEKYEIPWYYLYLLEIRNVEWNKNEIKKFSEFVCFLVNWYRKKFPDDDDFITNLFKRGRNFNLLSNGLTTIGRGIGCGIQSCLSVRVGDLTIVPCHRLAYKVLETGKFLKQDEKISGIEALNVDLFLAISSSDFRNFPFCENCLIRHFCSGGCLGSQFEVLGDPFTPIPTVCELLHARILSMLRTLKEVGILYKIINILDEKKKVTIQIMEEEGIL